MWIDTYNEFADAVALSTDADALFDLLGNQIDLGSAVGDDIGQGTQLYLVITVDTTVAESGSGATVQFSLASDDTAAMTVATATKHFFTPAFTVAQLVAGAKFVFPLPPLQVPANERYLGVLTQNAGGASSNLTAGKVNAFLTRDAGQWSAKANSANV
jgi:Bbp16